MRKIQNAFATRKPKTPVGSIALVKPEDRVNGYRCQSCGRITWTRDVDEGVTPFMICCTVCDGYAHSMFYNPDPRPGYVTHEWYKQTKEEALSDEKKWPGSLRHWEQGGLAMRPIQDGIPI